jgi:2-oxo-4-hydroxy-4-carboxy-5-ureidoimidazoline decarboxylase
VLRALAEGNRRYEEKFGYIFIICATGKSAGEMLAQLERRLAHDPGDEIAIAAAEQAAITGLRLERIDS